MRCLPKIVVCQSLLYSKIPKADSQEPMEEALEIDLVVLSSFIQIPKIISAAMLKLIRFFSFLLISFFKKLN